MVITIRLKGAVPYNFFFLGAFALFFFFILEKAKKKKITQKFFSESPDSRKGGKKYKII